MVGTDGYWHYAFLQKGTAQNLGSFPSKHCDIGPDTSPIQETAANILVEEIKKRTDLQLGLNNSWDNKTNIALALANEKELLGTKVPARDGENTPELKKRRLSYFS